MFRRRANPPRPASQAERLFALGCILDEHRFARDGLSILASDEGFVVVGYARAAKDAEGHLDRRTLEVTKLMLDEAFARHY